MNDSSAAAADTNTGGVSESVQSTLDHLARIVDREQVLAEAKQEAFDQLSVAVSREASGYDESTCVEVWDAVRAINLPFASTSIVSALEVPVAVLLGWKKELPPPGQRRAMGRSRFDGEFPLGYQTVPPAGQPCVYLLPDHSPTVVYVGMSMNVKARLKTHWTGPNKAWFRRWQIMTFDTPKAALDVEGDLIFHHQPILNKADRRKRRFVKP